MNKYLSDKLRVLSFILMILVVLLHSYKPVINFNSESLDLRSGFSFFFQLFFSEGIARIAVPLFFFISGYLFFLKLNGNAAGFLLKYRKRAKSLVLPYLLWSAWGLVFYMILQLVPRSGHFFTGEFIANYSTVKLLNTLFLNPIPYQLWFLRDLIVLVAIAPLIYWILKYSGTMVILLLFIIWLGLFEFNFVIFRNESIFFFCLGASICITKSTILLKKLDQAQYLAATFLWITTVALKTILIYQGSGQTIVIVQLGKLSILTGLIAIWSLYDMIMKNKKQPGNTLFGLSAFTFFIFGFHEPMLTLIQKGMFHIMGATEITATVNYIMAPAITVLIGILSGRFLKSHIPRFYGLITGGR